MYFSKILHRANLFVPTDMKFPWRVYEVSSFLEWSFKEEYKSSPRPSCHSRVVVFIMVKWSDVTSFSNNIIVSLDCNLPDHGYKGAVWQVDKDRRLSIYSVTLPKNLEFKPVLFLIERIVDVSKAEKEPEKWQVLQVSLEET